MIHLTRLNNQSLVLNADLIKFIEKAPDTVITLLTGDKLVVRESVEEVLERVREFQQKFSRRVAPTVVFEKGMSGESAGQQGKAGDAKS
jgi:flagellar protein FlbD